MIEVFEDKRVLTDCNRIVVKIGSALLTANGEGLDLEAISHWAEQLATPLPPSPASTVMTASSTKRMRTNLDMN